MDERYLVDTNGELSVRKGPLSRDKASELKEQLASVEVAPVPPKDGHYIYEIEGEEVKLKIWFTTVRGLLQETDYPIDSQLITNTGERVSGETFIDPTDGPFEVAYDLNTQEA